MPSIQRGELRLHGHSVCFRTAGEGPVVLLMHGITGSSKQWERLIPLLAERFTVIAPDLLGHGDSAKPRGDYSLGAYAVICRDMLVALGHPRASIVGHSLGGGIAMQFAYEYPHHTERLALVDSGGLGREVHVLLRAATLPGSEIVLPLLAHERLLAAGALVGRAIGLIGLQTATDITEIARGHASLNDAEARHAFIQTMRAVLDPGGQRVNATDRLYLAALMPSLIVWGRRDSLIPVAHADVAHAAMPGSRLDIFDESGHFPQLDEPERLARVLLSWMDETEPARIETTDTDLARMREQMLEGST